MTATRAGLRPGLTYGVLAFLAGGALGPVRELALLAWLVALPFLLRRGAG